MSSSKLDYLQKYLSKGDSLPSGSGNGSGNKKKKKKKKSKSNQSDKFKSRIIDDDEIRSGSGNQSGNGNESDDSVCFETREDQPQVAGFVDDRPDVVIMKEKFTSKTFQSLVKKDEEISEEEKQEEEMLLKSRKALLASVQIKEEPLDSDEVRIVLTHPVLLGFFALTHPVLLIY